MNGLTLTLAYKYVALVLMIGEANFFADKVGLALKHPITEQDVRSGSHVSPPRTNNFGGSVITDDFFFGFGWGHLANFKRSDFRFDSDASVRDLNLRLSKQQSLIDTNGAYQLAINWLSGTGIDIGALQKKYGLNIVQWRCRPEGLSQGPIMLPVYQVEWRGSLPKSPRSAAGVPVVTLTILGTTKELTEFHVLDDSLFLRPRITIGGQARLCAMPDAEFQSLDALQRSNLVFQCTTATPETNSPPSTRPNEHGPQ